MEIHVVSATAVRDGGETIQLAMCGEQLGRYDDAVKTHPVGNYIGPTGSAFDRVTCPQCRDRHAEVHARWSAGLGG